MLITDGLTGGVAMNLSISLGLPPVESGAPSIPEGGSIIVSPVWTASLGRETSVGFQILGAMLNVVIGPARFAWTVFNSTRRNGGLMLTRCQ